MDDAVEKWVPLIEMRLRLWRGHPDYDDLLQEARLAVWQAFKENRQQLKPCAESSIVYSTARWAALDYLRTRKASPRFLKPTAAPDPPMLSLEQIAAAAAERDEQELDQRGDLPHEPDFTAEWIEWQECREHWDRCFAMATEREREALALRYRLGCTFQEVATRMGVRESRVEQLTTDAIERYQCDRGLIAFEERRRVKNQRRYDERKRQRQRRGP